MVTGSAAKASLPYRISQHILIDPRFAHAQALALRLWATHDARSVQWRSVDTRTSATLLEEIAIRGSPCVRLQGVTAEALPFCLSQIPSNGRHPKLSIERMDQDLFAWTLEYSA